MKSKAKIMMVVVFNIIAMSSALACSVCKTNQPKLLQGITHGIGPESNWDYLIVVTMVAVVVGTLVLSIRYLTNPERNMNHIKNTILDTKTYE